MENEQNTDNTKDTIDTSMPINTIDRTNLSKKQRRRLEKAEADLKKQQQLKQAGSSAKMFWSVIAVVILAVLFGLWKLSQSNVGGSVDNSSSVQFIATAQANDHVKWKVDSPIVLIEYSDFQCPACGQYAPIIKDLEPEFADKIAFVYRHFPLKQIHAKAESAARAAESAGLQGAFFEYHDMLFDKQEEWSNAINAQPKFIQYAEELGLDIEKFKTDLTSDVVKKKVDDDLKSGNSARVTGTPTFYLNGKKIEPRSAQDFKDTLNGTLQFLSNELELDTKKTNDVPDTQDVGVPEVGTSTATSNE